MWIALQVDNILRFMGLTEEHRTIVGPFETKEAAEAYAAKHGYVTHELETPTIRRRRRDGAVHGS
jgi:hypothetical protein